MRQHDEMERVFYIDKEGRVMRLPVEELTPGVVHGIHEEFGEIWMDREIVDTDWGYPPLPESVRDTLRGLRDQLYEVHPVPLEEWEQDIQSVSHPTMRLYHWVGLGAAYRLLTEGRGLDTEAKAAIFRLLKAYLDYPADHALTLAGDYSPLPREAAEGVIRFVRECFDETLNQIEFPKGV